MNTHCRMHIEALDDISHALGFPVDENTFYIKHEIPEKYFHELTPADEEYIVGSQKEAVRVVMTGLRVYMVALVPSAEMKARKYDRELCNRLSEVFGFYSTSGCWAYRG